MSSIQLNSAIGDITLDATSFGLGLPDWIPTDQVINRVQPVLRELGTRLEQAKSEAATAEANADNIRDMSVAQTNELIQFKDQVRDLLIDKVDEGHFGADVANSILHDLNLKGLRKVFSIKQTVKIEVQVEVDEEYDGDGTDLVDINAEVSVSWDGKKVDAEINDEAVDYSTAIAEEMN